MEYNMDGVPMFNCQNGFEYEIWNNRMKVFLQAQGNDVWLAVVKGYNSTKKAKTTAKKELKKNNKIAIDFIWKALPDPVREIVGQYSSAKELWDKLHDTYSSYITESEFAKEDTGIEQKERCPSHQTDSEKEEEEGEGEGEVNLEAELISALGELRIVRKKNKLLEEENRRLKEEDGFEELIEEAKSIEEVLKGQLRKRERIQEELEIEILSLKKQLGEEKFGQEERRLENEIITLKTQLEEAKKIEEAMKNQMMKREEEVEKLEQEVVMLRSKIINNNKQTKTSTSEVKSEEKHSRVLEEKNKEKCNSYAEVLKGGNHGQEESKKNQDTSSARPATFKQQRTFKHDEEIHKRKYHDQARHKFKSATQQGRSSTPMYVNLFYGYCFYCSNFGHKVADCRAHQRNYQIRKAYVAPHNIECYKCHNYGHIARDCRSMMDISLRSKWSWKGKQEQKKRNKIK